MLLPLTSPRTRCLSHLKWLLTLCLPLLLISCGGSRVRRPQGLSSAVKTRHAEDPLTPLAQDSSQWVIEGQIHVSVASMITALDGLRTELKERGDVTRQDVKEGGGYPNAKLTLRVKPEELSKLLAWLRARGQVVHEGVSREEVSRRLLAQDVEISNAQATLERLKIFIDKDTLSVNEVLRVEQEMARLREIIERTERERELLKGRIAFATLHVTLSERPKALPHAPKAQFFVSGRPSFILSGPNTPETGWGVSLFNPRNPAAFHVDFDYFAPSKRTFLTIGSASYSDFFGAGQNNFLNPHIGFKIGYAQANGHNLAFGGSVGLELARFKYAFINLKAEGLGLVGSQGLEWLTLTGLDFAVVY